MKLTPIVDFILNHEANLPIYGSDTICSIIIGYAAFLKQPITLGMFIPCDENGNILTPYVKTDSEVFADENSHCRVMSKEEIQWIKAKQRVIFDNFTFCNKINTQSCVMHVETDVHLKLKDILGKPLETLMEYQLELTDDISGSFEWEE